MRRIVDFPHPDGPNSAVNDPAGAARSTRSSATTSDRRTRKIFPSWRSEMPSSLTTQGSFVGALVPVKVWVVT